mgnify:CR=1 FL=1
MGRVDGKVALISGGAQGMGAADAWALVAEGGKVVIGDILDDKGKALADEINAAHPDSARYVHLDVTQADEWEAAVATTVNDFGRLNVLVNNAGTVALGMIGQFDMAKWQKVIDVNLTGAFLCTQAAAARMRTGGTGGRVVNIASQAAKSGFRHMAPYVASKHGLIGLTRTAAIDLAADGITVNAVCPNHVTTGLGAKQSEYFAALRGLTPEDYRRGIAERIPLGRVGLPGDTAAAAAFLASDDAAFITGEALNVSGGEEMH